MRLYEEFGLSVSDDTIYRALKNLGFSHVSARPKAYKQNPAARTRTQRSRKHLAVHASELVVKPDFQILRRYRRPLLLRLEHTYRPALEDYVHRATRLGSSRSLNLRIGIRQGPRNRLWVESQAKQR